MDTRVADPVDFYPDPDLTPRLKIRIRPLKKPDPTFEKTGSNLRKNQIQPSKKPDPTFEKTGSGSKKLDPDRTVKKPAFEKKNNTDPIPI